MDINPTGTTTTQTGQLADPTIAFRVAPDISMAGATPTFCDAGFYVPELLALAGRERPRRPRSHDLLLEGRWSAGCDPRRERFQRRAGRR